MKMRRKTALVVLVLWVFAITSAIAEMTIVEIQPRRYEHIRSVYANITISGGVATVEGKANAGSDVRVVITVQLQRKDGNEWTSLGTWSGGSSASGSKSISRGNQYRAYVTARAYIGDSLVETVYKASSAKSY